MTTHTQRPTRATAFMLAVAIMSLPGEQVYALPSDWEPAATLS